MSRRPSIWVLFFCVLLACFGAAPGAAANTRELRPKPPANGQIGADRPLVVEVVLHDTLQPVSAESFRLSMEEANALHPAAILLNLSTPGGMADNAAAMAAVIEHSPAPVVVYVRDPTTHVSGEGMRLLEAGDVRAMSPGSTLVPSLGRSATQAALATLAPREAALGAALRNSAALHDRATSGSDSLLNDPDTVDAGEALQLGAVDMISSSEEKLLARLNGVQVHRANGAVTTLQLNDSFLTLMPMTLREHMMRALMNPDLTVLLLALGGLLLYLEVNTPGGVVPGAAGLLLALLAIYALLQMPLRWEGLMLLAFAGVMLLAEAHFQRGLGFAVVALLFLVAGLRLLVRAPIPELEVNWGTAIGAGVGFGGVTGGLLLLGLKARRAKVRTGAEAMLGWLAVTQTALAPEGEILVRGELWRARLSGVDAFVAAGESVKVEGALGAVLEVAPLPNLQGN